MKKGRFEVCCFWECATSTQRAALERLSSADYKSVIDSAEAAWAGDYEAVLLEVVGE